MLIIVLFARSIISSNCSLALAVLVILIPWSNRSPEITGSRQRHFYLNVCKEQTSLQNYKISINALATIFAFSLSNAAISVHLVKWSPINIKYLFRALRFGGFVLVKGSIKAIALLSMANQHYSISQALYSFLQFLYNFLSHSSHSLHKNLPHHSLKHTN